MKTDLKEELEIPEGTEAKLEQGIFIIKGKNGEIRRKLYNPKIVSRLIGNKITFESKSATQREKKLIKSYRAHLNNMFRGVNEPHVYKLKICSGHFPMSVTMKGNVLVIFWHGETLNQMIWTDSISLGFNNF